MLSSKGNENGEKTTIGLISKKATLQHTFLICTFLCHCFAQLQRETSRNFLVTYFMKEISYVIFNTHFFFHCHSFSPLATSISHFLNAASNFSCCPNSNKECLLCFSSPALALFHFFSHWASLDYRLHVLSLFSVFLLFCIPNCGHDSNINLSLILLDNTDTVVSASWQNS